MLQAEENFFENNIEEPKTNVKNTYFSELKEKVAR